LTAAGKNVCVKNKKQFPNFKTGLRLVAIANKDESSSGRRGFLSPNPSSALFDSAFVIYGQIQFMCQLVLKRERKFFFFFFRTDMPGFFVEFGFYFYSQLA
jgi:hypothetical protein